MIDLSNFVLPKEMKLKEIETGCHVIIHLLFSKWLMNYTWIYLMLQLKFNDAIKTTITIRNRLHNSLSNLSRSFM